MLPLLQQVLRLLDQFLPAAISRSWNRVCLGVSYSLLSRRCDVLIGLKERSDVQSLAPPEISMDSPVEGELERAPVEATTAC